MSITVETCGKSYCEHYPEGLFTCAKCREASTLAHDKACAKIAEARADADHWKSECNALQRMVHEARAEIERKDETIDACSIMLKARETLIYKQAKLIEQMLEALELLSEAVRSLDEQISTVHNKIVITDAVSLLRRQNDALLAMRQAEAAIAAAKGEV